MLNAPNWRRAVANSLIVALGSVTLATPLGVLGAFGLVRGRFLGRRAVMQLSTATMIVPGIVVAVAMYFLYAGWASSAARRCWSSRIQHLSCRRC